YDSQFLATASADGRAIVWSLTQRDGRLAILTAHLGSVWGVDFSPNDYSLISASDDMDLIRSLLTPVERPGTLAFNTNQTIPEFEVDTTTGYFVLAGEPSGQLISNIQVWDSINNELKYEISMRDVTATTGEETIRVTDLAISSDGTLGAISLS